MSERVTSDSIKANNSAAGAMEAINQLSDTSYQEKLETDSVVKPTNADEAQRGAHMDMTSLASYHLKSRERATQARRDKEHADSATAEGDNETAKQFNDEAFDNENRADEAWGSVSEIDSKATRRFRDSRELYEQAAIEDALARPDIEEVPFGGHVYRHDEQGKIVQPAEPYNPDAPAG